jgi:hypothetical protein
MEVSDINLRDVTGIEGIKIQNKGIFYYNLSNNRHCLTIGKSYHSFHTSLVSCLTAAAHPLSVLNLIPIPSDPSLAIAISICCWSLGSSMVISTFHQSGI